MSIPFPPHLQHDVPIIVGDLNVNISKDQNNQASLLTFPYRNGEHLKGFPLEKRLEGMDTKCQNRNRIEELETDITTLKDSD